MKSRTTGSLILLALAAVGTTVLLCFRSSVAEAVYPVERAFCVFRQEVCSRVRGVFNAAAEGAENVRLRRDVAALSMLRGDVERLEVENARLRRALDYTARADEKWLPAGVLSAGGGAAAVRDTIRVDKGSLAGVRTGAVVAVPEGLVGRVTAVSPHTAEVTLVTDPLVKVACEIEVNGSTVGSGILSGGSADVLVLQHVRKTSAALSHAQVITSGRGGVFPRGLAVGRLQSVTNDVRGLRGEVLPQVDFARLEDVFIRREK